MIDMYAVSVVVSFTAFSILMCVSLLLVARVFLLLFMQTQARAWMIGVVNLAEAFIYPVRAFCNRMGWFKENPIDIPAMLTFILVSVVTWIFFV